MPKYHSEEDLPQSFEIEQNYLRILVNDTSKIQAGDGELFFTGRHQEILAQLIKQRDGGLVKSDYADLMRRLEGKASVQECAIQVYSCQADESLGSYYRNILIDLKDRRQIVSRAISIIELAQDQDQSIDQIAIECEKLRIDREDANIATSKDLVQDFNQWLDDLQDGKMDDEGITWGFGLDAVIDKLRPSELCLVGGRPNSGKSSIANSVVALSCIPHKRPTLIISLEHAKRKAIQRLVSIAGRIPFAQMNERDRLSAEEYTALAKAMDAIHASNIGISDNTYSFWEIESAARTFHKQHGLDLIIIDYAQMMDGMQGKDATVALDAAGIAAKRLAKELNCCVILITSINWEHEAPSNCSALEYHCDQYILVHKDTKYEDGQIKKKITVRKQRDGPSGDVWIPWYGPCMAFY